MYREGLCLAPHRSVASGTAARYNWKFGIYQYGVVELQSKASKEISSFGLGFEVVACAQSKYNNDAVERYLQSTTRWQGGNTLLYVNNAKLKRVWWVNIGCRVRRKR